ncbi:hypothetical protein Pint_21877 [Pistacia integerrima]|uniref:Uncharacterized protein n=1 Tax=Pistacia integerrima TaxID=434235 RepID=A0ACC0X998_9ROSI|nr:hypothetical protein Pint_21877 [Pistacia integerrima]
MSESKMKKKKHSGSIRGELYILVAYAVVFYVFIIRRSLQISNDHYKELYALRPGWLSNFLYDVSDAQWRNFRSNIPILSVFILFYLHGACVIFILSIASLNFLLVKVFARTNYFPFLLWGFNIFFLICNRVYEGYSFSLFGCVVYDTLVIACNDGHIWTTFEGPLGGIFALTLGALPIVGLEPIGFTVSHVCLTF